MKNWKERFSKKFTDNVLKDGKGNDLITDQAEPIINFIEQIISEREKEVVEIITQHYIPGHMVVNPTLEAIITKVINNK